MLTSAHAAYDAFFAMGSAHPGRPDLIDLQIAFSQKIMNAELLLHPTGPEPRKAIEEHKKRLGTIAVTAANNTPDAKGADAQIQSAMAEADYMLATEEERR